MTCTYCPHCGGQVAPLRCDHCGEATITPGAKFCSPCGGKHPGIGPVTLELVDPPEKPAPPKRKAKSPAAKKPRAPKEQGAITVDAHGRVMSSLAMTKGQDAWMQAEAQRRGIALTPCLNEMLSVAAHYLDESKPLDAPRGESAKSRPIKVPEGIYQRYRDKAAGAGSSIVSIMRGALAEVMGVRS